MFLVTCGAYCVAWGVSRVVSSRTLWCLAYLWSEFYASLSSLTLVYAVIHIISHVVSA
jgi:hypothetical protein